MRNFLLGITVLGVIIWTSSYAPSDEDKNSDPTARKKSVKPRRPESLALVAQFVSLGVPLTVLGILGLILYYLFLGITLPI
ncbi:MAG: hypothetical protein IPF71_02985 [Rhodoferax sp.]|nr:hypothetical protein [Rhodoferax sp.]